MFAFDLFHLLLLGQAAPENSSNGVLVLIALIWVGMLMFAALLVIGLAPPDWLTSRGRRQERERRHQERLKAIELGRPLPEDCPWWTPARLIAAIGAGVPISVFALAWLAVLTTRASANSVYAAASVVGGIAVICGTALAWRWMFAQKPLETKPHFESEAYDLSGHHS